MRAHATVAQKPARPVGWGWHRVALVIVVCVLLAGTGLAGTARYMTTFWLYRGFPAPRLPHSVVVHSRHGTHKVRVTPPSVQTISVTSPALGGRKDAVEVVLPPGYTSQSPRRYPVMYLLHGFPGYPSNFLAVGDIESTEATLLAKGQIQPMILVMPTGTFSFFADEEWANHVEPGNNWETFVARDLVNAIDARYRTVGSGSGRGIGGLSEGGYAALNIGIHHPGEFGLLESWSGYMTADDPAIFGHDVTLMRYNSPADQVVPVAAQLIAARTYIWFYCGASDELTKQNADFDAELTRLGVAHSFFERPGTHNWRLWRELMPQALITASEHLHG
jgi:S-formylglutathione hydrolase FrmB